MLLNNEKTNLPPPKFLQIKQEDKTFARFLSKDQNSETINPPRAGGESSFRVMYYGGATGSIPFRWESRPGTPKHELFSDTSSLPPLTPPPSYQLKTKTNDKFQEKGTHNNKSKLLHALFSKFAISSRKTNITPISSSSTYSLSSSSCSNSSSSYSFTSRKDSVPRSISPIYFGLEDDNNNDNDDHHEEQHEPTRSSSRRRTLTLCFGTTTKDGVCWRRSSLGRRQLEMKSFRKGFLSIFVAHGTV